MLAVSLLRFWNETTAALVTTGYGLFHIEAELVATVVIAVIFNHQLNTSTHTEARVYWLRLLFAQFMYCLTSVFRVLVNIGIIANSPMVAYTILALNFMSMHAAAWLAFVYVEVSQNSKLAGSLKNKILSAIPLIIEAAIFIFAPISGLTINSMSGSLKIGSLFMLMMTIAPLYYLAAAVLAWFRRAKMTRYERDTTGPIGIYPTVLFVVICIQALNWKIPLFCNAIMIADVYVYIRYSDSLVSIDPLTKIPNKNGLTMILAEYIRKINTAPIEEDAENEKNLYVFAVDVDDLNDINASYGRMDGDNVLVTVAQALKKFSDEAHECFISRYYSDEFILVAEIAGKNEFDMFIEHVRNYIGNAAITKKLPYYLRVNIGWAKYEKFSKLETVSGLIEEATRVLNENKEQRKFQNFWQQGSSDSQGGGINLMKTGILTVLITLFLTATGDSMEIKNNIQKESPWLNSNIMSRASSFDVPAPKDDFYLSVNYDWIKNAKLKPGRAAHGSFTELQYELDANLRALMTDDTLKGHDADLIRNLYALWLDWDARNKNGLGKLKTHVDAVAKIKSINGLSEYFKSDECKFYGSSIANFGLGLDNDDPNFYNIEISATGLSLGDAAEYKNLSANGQRVKKMSEGIALYMLKKLGYSETQSKKILEQAYEFEKTIAASMMTHEELASPESLKKLYKNKITLDEIREKSKIFPFAEILEAYKVFSDLMNLQQPKWLEALNKIYNESQLENIKSYLIRNIASEAITRIDEEAFREYQKLSRERLGIKESAPDNEIAADFVHGHLLTPLSKIYVEKYISPETKQDVTNIINETIGYYREMLKDENWLSESTRQKAIEKLDAIKPRVAYPDKWRDYSGLDIKSKNDDETLETALDKLNKFGWENFYSKLNTKVDREMWGDSDVIIVNSYYYPSKNEIFIIAGILSGDFYGPERSREENLGGIGAVIGHELSHAFDTNGAQMDKNGAIKDWWQPEDYERFQARADRLIKYLSGMKVTPEGDFYNGSLVQTETIADMAGVKAMLGLASRIKADGGDFDYDKFFKAYARIWSNIMTPARLDYLLKIDVHALPYIRVNAIVQQYEEFFKTYGIKSGDLMYLAPEDRVAVW